MFFTTSAFAQPELHREREGALEKSFYANGRQFNSVVKLKQVVHEKWDAMTTPMVQHISESMPDRCLDVVQGNGAMTKY